MKEYVMLESKKLFGSDKIVKILHNGNIYVLRITKDNKLILTK